MADVEAGRGGGGAGVRPLGPDGRPLPGPAQDSGQKNLNDFSFAFISQRIALEFILSQPFLLSLFITKYVIFNGNARRNRVLKEDPLCNLLVLIRSKLSPIIAFRIWPRSVAGLLCR